MTDEEQKHQEFLAQCAKFTGDIEKLIETHEKVQKTLSELEYACYIKLIWSRFGTWDEKCSITPTFRYGASRRGYLALKRSDGASQTFPVHISENRFTGVNTAFNVTDMWDDGLLPERFFELFLLWCNKKSAHAQGNVRAERKRRLEREAKRTPPKRDYLELARGVTFVHAGPLMEPDSIASSDGGIWTDSTPGDGESEEVET